MIEKRTWEFKKPRKLPARAPTILTPASASTLAWLRRKVVSCKAVVPLAVVGGARGTGG